MVTGGCLPADGRSELIRRIRMLKQHPIVGATLLRLYFI
jgi:hypothetical protein